MDTKPSVVAGRVSKTGGQPVAQARVYWMSGPVSLPDIVTLTDEAGKFSLSAPVGGTYQLGCTADGFAPATVTVAVKGGQNTQIEIVLKP